MILSPYQSHAGRVYDTDLILSEIKKASVLDVQATRPGFASVIEAGDVRLITQNTPEVPGFMHPIVDLANDKAVYVDARPYVTQRRDGDWSIRSQNDLEALVRRARLSALWAEGDITDFLALGELPLKLYLNWVGNTVGRHLAIDPLTQFRVSALAGIHYLSQHYEADQLNDERYQVKIAEKVSRAMRGSLEEVLELMVDQDPLESLDLFVGALETRTGSVRMNDVSVAYLFNVVGGSWFGNNAREVTAMALDHIPTWISILYQSMNDRSYRKSGLSQLVGTLTRAQEHKDFTRSVGLLLKE